MAKYYKSSPGDSHNLGGSGCRQYVDTGTHAFDVIGDGCWGVTGVRIVIGGFIDSDQAAAERCNFNVSQDATQPPIPTNLALESAKLGVLV